MGLFSGKPDAKPAQSSPGPTRQSPPPATRAVAPQKGSASTVIGQNAIIRGEIESDQDMLIEGRVEGKIRGRRSVVIGESGNVKAQVHGAVVSVQGEVHGDCEAENKVEIASTGKVFGNISAERIVVSEGATFRGASRMAKPSKPKPVEPKSVAPAPTVAAPPKPNPTPSTS